MDSVSYVFSVLLGLQTTLQCQFIDHSKPVFKGTR